MPGEDHWALGLRDQVGGLLDLVRVRREIVLAVAAQLHLVAPVELALLLQGVPRNVDEHRTGPARRRDMKRLLHRARDVIDVQHELVVLGDRDRDALDVRLLESVAADQRPDHLAGHADQRYRVHEGGGDAGHQVRGAGPGRGVADAGRALDAGVGVGGVRGGLLVLHRIVLDAWVVFGQHVVKRQVGAAGQPEDRVDADAKERLHHHLSAGVFFLVPVVHAWASFQSVSLFGVIDAVKRPFVASACYTARR